MSSLVEKKEVIVSLRKRFADSIEKKDLYYVEVLPELKDLELKGSAFQKMPKTNEELDLMRAWVKRVKALQKSVESYRMDATSPLDDLKANMIAEQRDMFSSLNPIEAEVTKYALLYVQEQDRIKKEAEARALKEKNKTIELSVLKEKIKNSSTTALSETILNLNRTFSTSWASLKLDGFDSRIGIMKGYKPKIEMDTLIKYFDYNYQYHTPDEFEGILRAEFDFDKFKAEVEKALDNTKKEYAGKVDEKRKQLEEQTEAQRLKLIEDNNNEEINKAAQAIVDKQKADELLKEKEADIKLQVESNTLNVIHGSGLKNIRNKKVAYITGTVDWNTICNIFISENGTDKLNFLLLNLQKKGCPDVQGISYREEVGVIFK